MKKILSNLLIFFGGLSIIIAGVILVQNYIEEQNAQNFSSQIIEQMLVELPNIENNQEIQDQPLEIIIDDEIYIGILEIPSLEITLPIQKDWSYEKLKKTPCVYTGDFKNDNLIIMGHNYAVHFGKLSTLNIGDQIIFKDIYGRETYFIYSEKLKVDSKEVDTIQNGNWDLTIFTCNSNNNNQRFVYRYNKIK